MNYDRAMKYETCPFATTWVCLGCIYSKRYRSDRKRQMPRDFTYLWNLKTKQKENRLIQIQKISGSCKKGGGGWQSRYRGF